LIGGVCRPLGDEPLANHHGLAKRFRRTFELTSENAAGADRIVGG
jgi:hypothetical protein